LLRLGAGFVFYALMDAVVDRYFPLIDDFESELEQIEQDIFEHGTARGRSSGCTRSSAAPRCCAMRWRR
jgi:Mg2+ and Co2+ transporter CorA